VFTALQIFSGYADVLVRTVVSLSMDSVVDPAAFKRVPIIKTWAVSVNAESRHKVPVAVMLPK
jgi:hypothetical protein